MTQDKKSVTANNVDTKKGNADNGNASTDNANTQNSNVANTNKSVKAILESGKKEASGQSAYGATVATLCNDLSLLADKPKLLEHLTSIGIDVKKSSNAINTGVNQTKKVIELLVQNGYLQ